MLISLQVSYSLLIFLYLKILKIAVIRRKILFEVLYDLTYTCEIDILESKVLASKLSAKRRREFGIR